MKSKLFILLFAIVFSSCREKTTVFTWSNPNPGLDFRDTDILNDNGTWYAVGTCFPYWQEGNPGVKLYSSPDLKNWKFEKLLIDASALPDSSWYKERFWAPELRKIGAKYFLTYNCCSRSVNQTNACSIAVASNISGPYTVMTPDAPLTPFCTNDLTLLEDGGKVYAFFNGWFEGNTSHIYLAEIDPETCRLKETPVKVLSPGEKGTWDEVALEGSCIFKRNNIYYLMYSSFTWGYEVGYATATNIRGPWTKYENNPVFGSFRKDDTTFVYRDGQAVPSIDGPAYEGIGHNQVFVGPDGRYWVSFHGVIKGVEKAVTIIDPIWFEDGKIRTNTPSVGEQHVEVSTSIIKNNKQDIRMK